MTQDNALAIMKMGKSIYLTGGAGSGKTYVLNAFIKYLYEHDIDVAITASTGIAATHIGGMTIHAWSGIGIRDHVTDWDIEIMEEKKYLWDRYDKVKVLIIDEISMLSGTFLDTLDRICRAFKRKPELPFGGIQVVLCGDLFQLPPVTKKGEPVSMVIDAKVWKTMNPIICYLTEQHRQDDEIFTDILNSIRKNDVQDYHLETLEERIREYSEDDFQSVTKLFTHNADVDTINNQQLAAIDEEEFVFYMESKGKENLIETLKKSCLAPEKLVLKLGAEVMFVKNSFEQGYVNGTRGTVIDFTVSNQPVVKLFNGKEITVDPETWAIDDHGKILASITQIPLRHAWAITVHKSQGMSLDAAVIDLSRAFAFGMGYVALSRVRTLSGLHLVGFSQSALVIDPRILKMDQQLQNMSDRAEVRLGDFSKSELQDIYNNFILQSGGTIEAKKGAKKTKHTNTSKSKTHEITYELIASGKTIAEVAEERQMTIGTTLSHLEKVRQLGGDLEIQHILPDKKDTKIIIKALQQLTNTGTNVFDIKLTEIKNYLNSIGYDFDFDTIRLVRCVF